MPIKTVSYTVDFSLEGDEETGIKGVEAQLLGYRMNFGKCLVSITKLTKLPGPKAKSDALGLRKVAGLTG